MQWVKHLLIHSRYWIQYRQNILLSRFADEKDGGQRGEVTIELPSDMKAEGFPCSSTPWPQSRPSQGSQGCFQHAVASARAIYAEYFTAFYLDLACGRYIGMFRGVPAPSSQEFHLG